MSQCVAAAAATVVNSDATDGQQRNGTQIEAKFPPAHRDRGRIDDGRQHQKQDQLWREIYRWQPGDEREHDAGKYQENSGRDFQSLRDDPDHGNYD